jgi:hypothetical protein
VPNAKGVTWQQTHSTDTCAILESSTIAMSCAHYLMSQHLPCHHHHIHSALPLRLFLAPDRTTARLLPWFLRVLALWTCFNNTYYRVDSQVTSHKCTICPSATKRLLSTLLRLSGTVSSKMCQNRLNSRSRDTVHGVDSTSILNGTISQTTR